MSSDFRSYMASLLPIQRLSFAMIAESMLDAALMNGDLSTAKAWFSSRDPDYVFSYERCCETLAFDPNYLRKLKPLWVRALRESIAGLDQIKARTKANRVLYLLTNTKRKKISAKDVLKLSGEIFRQRQVGYD